MMVIMAGGAWAIDRTAAKIQGVGVPACVAISSTTWTAIPAIASIKSGRGGIFIAAPSSTVGAFNIVMASSPVTAPSVATTIHAYTMEAKGVQDFEASQYVYMFAFSTHTLAASQNLCYQEYTLEKDR